RTGWRLAVEPDEDIDPIAGRQQTVHATHGVHRDVDRAIRLRDLILQRADRSEREVRGRQLLTRIDVRDRNAAVESGGVDEGADWGSPLRTRRTPELTALPAAVPGGPF